MAHQPGGHLLQPLHALDGMGILLRAFYGVRVDVFDWLSDLERTGSFLGGLLLALGINLVND